MGDARLNPRSPSYRGAMTAQDGYGRPIEIGDEVVAPTMKLQAPRFVVGHVAPNLAPGAPPHTMTIVLRAEVVIQVKANTPVAELFLLRTVAERLGTEAAEDLRDKLAQADGADLTPREAVPPPAPGLPGDGESAVANVDDGNVIAGEPAPPPRPESGAGRGDTSGLGATSGPRRILEN